MSNELQLASQDILEQKYLLRDFDSNLLESSFDEAAKRVAKALAKNDKGWEKRFITAMKNGAVPAGRILANAGAEEFKPSTSTINCTVSGTVPDTMEGILDRVKEAGLTLKAGCGIGYEFSTLRPSGAFVRGAGATTSGPLSFMDIFDRACFTVSSAGGRRGAQMATFDIRHPDVEEFIKAKKEAGRLRQFNLSLLITDDFIEAVKNDEAWPLRFPLMKSEVETGKAKLEDALWEEWPLKDEKSYFINDEGLVALRVYRTVQAKHLWNLIMSNTYDYAEPGFILIDRVNEMNNNWFCEHIRATNPCAEQPLPPYGACLLGSINLTKMVKMPFTESAEFDWAKFIETVTVFSRMLDNVVDNSGLPLEEQREEIRRKRRHGMGIIGLGSVCAMLRMKYGSEEAAQLSEDISREMAVASYEAGLELAKEKGAAPVMEEDFTVTGEMLRKRSEMVTDGYKEGDVVKGKVLWAKYSRYMQQIGKVNPSLVEQLAETGCRYTHATSIAPTGTISLSVGNNASNGIEPSFGHHYQRNVIIPGKKTKQKVDVFSFELLKYRELVNEGAMPFSKDPETRLPEYFIISDDLKPAQHVVMQSAVQKWVDSSISKTVNVPTNIDFSEFQDVYMDAYEQGLKGCTTFRFNPDVFSGVLVKEQDLADTTYKFELEGGEFVELKGNDEVEYDGDLHTAANLYDALSDGYFGRL